MKIGYARVSTGDQNLDLQRDALIAAGCGLLYEETLSGAQARRPALRAALRRLRRGDVLVVWKLDRLGRSLQELVSILSRLEQRGIDFITISNVIDTTTPAGKLLFHVIGAVAEFERSLIVERTRAGMQAARLQGRLPGRPKRLGPAQVSHVLTRAVIDEMPLAAIAREMAIGKTTVWRVVSAFKQEATARHEAAAAVIAAEQTQREVARAVSVIGDR